MRVWLNQLLRSKRGGDDGMRSGAADGAPAAADPGSSAVALLSSGDGTTIEVDGSRVEAGRSIVIGRHASADVVVDDDCISKRHAELSLRPDGRLEVRDLGSLNGTWTSGGRVDAAVIASGERVRFGHREYTVMLKRDMEAAREAGWMLSCFDEDGQVMQLELRPETDPQSGLAMESIWSVGRADDLVDVVIERNDISKMHARFRFIPGMGLEVMDLGSTNGTFVDDERIDGNYRPLSGAECIRFATIEFTLSRL
ncbi:MAG: FHA domain-containing protein [Hyphomicrobiaceae bacterium]|nr:FHA domain-containing protein [Hyphomicrobiaceae bacterium]